MVCDDGNECTDEWCYCGGCIGPFDKEDGIECTFDASSGVCVSGLCGENLCKHVECDDGNACTDDTCDFVDGSCDFQPTICNDEDPCTKNTCEPALGCIFTQAEDGTGCAGGVIAACLDGKCVEACDRSAQDEYQCPILGLEFKTCCPGEFRCRDNCEFNTCDDSSQDEYPCPVPGLEQLVCYPYSDQCMPDCELLVDPT